MRRYLIPSLLLALGACAGTATYSGTAEVDSPDLVYAEPGVQVVADYDEPVFYSNNFYWREHNGGWERSNYYNRGFVHAEAPGVVANIQTRERFRHYRPAGYARRDHRRR